MTDDPADQHNPGQTPADNAANDTRDQSAGATADPADAPAKQDQPKNKLAAITAPARRLAAAAPRLAGQRARNAIARAKPTLHTPPAKLAHRLAIPALFLAAASIFSAVTVQASTAEGPNFNAALDSVEQRIKSTRYDEALELLNARLGERILTEEANDTHRGRFYTLSADALYFAQQAKGIDLDSNHRRIAEFFRTARDDFNYALTDDQNERLARSLARLGKVGEAITEARRLARGKARIALLREIIENDLNAPKPHLTDDRAASLIQQIATGEQATKQDRLWANEWDARFLLRAGRETAAIDRLLTRIQKLDDKDSQGAARLFALLGRAYVDAGHPRAARKHLEHAIEHLPRAHPATAEAEVSLARVSAALDQPERAADRFTTVIQRFPSSGPAALAQLGLAEIAASQGDNTEANNRFNHALDAVNAGDAAPFLSREHLIQRIEAAHDRLALERNFRNALLFAQTLERAHPAPTPPNSLRRTAETHADIAATILTDTPRASSGLPRLDRVDPAKLEQARKHHFEAAKRYRTLARQTMANQPEDAARALWNAAANFDKAGDLDNATAAFSEYVQLRKSDDPRLVAALFRLARAHQAANNLNDAIRVYERLLAEHPTSDEAYRTYVPLARSYLLLNTDEGDRAAQRHLTTVVEGQIIEPDAPEYRRALIELGRLYLRSDRYDDATRYARAIEHLDAARKRYPSVRDDPALLISLANANRLSANAITADLQRPLRPSERQRLRGTRDQRLRDAIDLYADVEQMLRERLRPAAAPDDTTTPERLLRDALLHHADAAYALAKHLRNTDASRADDRLRDAITKYDAVARRYPDDQIALVAMVQIVNCHVRLQNWQHARTAQRKARARLDQLPPGSLDDPASLMSRDQWEEWLDSTLHLDALAEADALTNR